MPTTSNSCCFIRYPADVYPLIAVVAAGTSFLIYSGFRHVSSNPEVHINPRDRSRQPWEREPLLGTEKEKDMLSDYSTPQRFASGEQEAAHRGDHPSITGTGLR